VYFNRILGRIKSVRLDLFDALATLTEFTAQAIVLNYRLHLESLPQTVILTGGGAANKTLAQRVEGELRRLVPEVYVVDSTAFGWPLQSVEPAAFALLAFLRYREKPGNVPATTGAKRAAVLGQVSVP